MCGRPIALEVTKTDLLTGAIMEGVAFDKQESEVYTPAKAGETRIGKLVSDRKGVVRIECLRQCTYTPKAAVHGSSPEHREKGET